MSDIDLEAASAGLAALADHNIPVDVQELLIFGDPSRSIPPGALSACIKAVLEEHRAKVAS